MFLRMVTHAVRENAREEMADAYGRFVMSALRTTPGCAFASLLQNVANPHECISMTIWDSQKHSSDYEESGLYQQLVNALRPMFVESNEWKLELSADLSLEYTPILSEPIVERFNESAAGPEQISKLRASPFAVQIIALSVQEVKTGMFEQIFSDDIHPALRDHKGFIDLILLRKQHEFYIISFWDETVDIESLCETQAVGLLSASLRSVIPSYVLWPARQGQSIRTSASSEDVRFSVHRCLLAEWFTA